MAGESENNEQIVSGEVRISVVSAHDAALTLPLGIRFHKCDICESVQYRILNMQCCH